MPELDAYFEAEHRPQGQRWEEDLALLETKSLSSEARDNLHALQALSQDFATLSDIHVNDNFESKLAEKLATINQPVPLKRFYWLPYATVAAAVITAILYFSPEKPPQQDPTRQYLLQVQIETSPEIEPEVRLTPEELNYPEDLVQEQPHLAL